MRLASAWTSRAGTASPRLALLEGFLGVDDAAECIERVLAWLGDHAGVDEAICALANPDTGELSGGVGRGVTSAQAEAFTVALDDIHHPLVQAIESRKPRFSGGAPDDTGPRHGRGPNPFGRVGYWAVPLGTIKPGDQCAGGLLLVLDDEPAPDIIWAADVLGRKLHNLSSNQALTEGENRLRRERSLLHAVVNAVADPILLTNPSGRLLIANSRAEAFFSTAPGQSEGRRRAVELNNMFLSAALWRIAVAPTEIAPQELPLVDPADGSDLLFELLGSVVHDPREGTGIVSVLRNVTDLRRATEELAENYHRIRVAEEEVRAERDRLNVVIDSVADPILMSDAAGKITLMNEPAERLFTIGPDGDGVMQRRVQSNDAQFSTFISGLLSAGTDSRRRGEVSLIDVVSGADLPFEAIAGKVLTEVGELIAVVTILHDRSEVLERAHLYEQVKRASEELEAKVVAATAELERQNQLLRRQAMELEQASSMKSQFLANMSHEFRTPLNAILGYAAVLLQGVSGELNPIQRKSLERISSNGRHLVDIVSEILDIARIEAGRMPLRVTTFTVGHLASEVMAEMESIVARSKLTVTSHVAPTLGLVRSDRQKVKQIMLNLLSNALKFTHEGSISIHAAPGETPDKVVISVRDTGIGIAPADRDKIFDDFHQVDSTAARQYGGTGLGLSICRRLATILGGRIILESEAGRGSTFTLVMPARLRK